jgi:serine/threonine protein kinase
MKKSSKFLKTKKNILKTKKNNNKKNQRGGTKKRPFSVLNEANNEYVNEANNEGKKNTAMATNRKKNLKKQRVQAAPSTIFSEARKNPVIDDVDLLKRQQFSIEDEKYYADNESTKNNVKKSIKSSKKNSQQLRNEETTAYQSSDKVTEPMFVSRGASGCVYYPPLPCLDTCKDDPRCSSDIPRVSKLMLSSVADKEIKTYNVDILFDTISIPDGSNWKKYFIGEPYLCSPKLPLPDSVQTECSIIVGKNPSNLRLIIFENGGPSLSKLTKDSKIPFYEVLLGLKNVLDGLVILNKNGIFHFDVKPDNIVTGFNPPHNHFRLIDFGLSNRGKFLNNVNITDIKFPILSGEATQMMTPTKANGPGVSTPLAVMTPTRPTRQENTFHTPKSKSKLQEVNTPVIYRIFPIYQFFLNNIFYDESRTISTEIYELLSSKFVETFLKTDDYAIKDLIMFYVEYRYLLENNDENYEENYEILKDIMDNVYRTWFEGKTVDARKIYYEQMFKTMDIYSFSLGLLQLVYIYQRRASSMLKSDNDFRTYYHLLRAVKKFIGTNNLLHPDPFVHNYTLDDIKQTYDVLISQIEGEIISPNQELFSRISI